VSKGHVQPDASSVTPPPEEELVVPLPPSSPDEDPPSSPLGEPLPAPLDLPLELPPGSPELAPPPGETGGLPELEHAPSAANAATMLARAIIQFRVRFGMLAAPCPYPRADRPSMSVAAWVKFA
jgi:hypothetical protein